ncbi:MAG: arginase family protein [Saprospiraceae bacterium]
MRKGYEGYDPNGVGVDNGNFLGLPIVDDPAISFLSVPYDATVSYSEGTAGGPANILAASTQLDVSIPGLDRPWELGFVWKGLSGTWLDQLAQTRTYVKDVITTLEKGSPLSENQKSCLTHINRQGEALRQTVFTAVKSEIDAGRLPVLVGGEHSISLGAFEAAATKGDFGILQIDAHMDLRSSYEGFEFSHASVMYNAINTIPQLSQLTQVAIRDWCPAEEEVVHANPGRIAVFYDQDLSEAKLRGEAFAKTIQPIIATLPQRVWISFDIDGLDPSLCAHTGTPVPGGLSFAEAKFLCQAVLESGRTIIGLDLVEVAPAPHEYEGSVAARLMYEIAARAVSANKKP